MTSARRWASATDLAEYAYCPRALYYRTQSPEARATPAEASGRRYHERALGSERRRAEHPAAYWAVLAAGILLAVAGALEGLHP